MKPLALEAIFSKATTTIDGGWRISFDCSEEMSAKIGELSKMRGSALYLVVMDEEEYQSKIEKK
jgi:hypothetical protein